MGAKHSSGNRAAGLRAHKLYERPGPFGFRYSRRGSKKRTTGFHNRVNRGLLRPDFIDPDAGNVWVVLGDRPGALGFAGVPVEIGARISSPGDEIAAS